MADLKPTIKTNFYGFDYYEVAYTCLATQHPILGNFKFPNLTFAGNQEYLDAMSTPINDAPTSQTIGDIFSQNINDRDVITINDVRANNVVTNNIGVEFYTETWKNAFDLCKEINTFHTWKVGIGGTYASEDQRNKARRLLWNKWWKTILFAQIDITEFFQLGLVHSLITESMSDQSEADAFNAWLVEQGVCESTQLSLSGLFSALPMPITPQFNDTEANIVTTSNSLNAVGVYHSIEKINVTSTSAGCFSPYVCQPTPTKYDVINMSSGTEDEVCVTYWRSATPPTSSLSEAYISLNGECSSASTKDWTKYNLELLRRPRIDFMKIKGRMIVPNETFVTRTGISIITAQDLFNNCNSMYDVTVYYTPFTQSFESPYGECCVVSGGNWAMNSTMDNPYNIKAIPKSVADDAGSISIIIPQAFFVAMKDNPALLNQEFAIEWNIKLQVSGECLSNAIIKTYTNSFYPACLNNTIYYLQDCGIIFNDAEGFSNGDNLNALVALDEMHGLVRRLFGNIYNCYAREVSKTQIYGDIIKVVGRFYDEHGSECWLLFKQVLRPTIAEANTVKDEQLKGFNLPNPTVATPTVATNQVLPEPTQVPSVNLSNMFKKGNKLCSTLPQPLKYK